MGVAAAGIPNNSETYKGGAPELSSINMKAKKIVDFPIFVWLVVYLHWIDLSGQLVGSESDERIWRRNYFKNKYN